jgi:hypothetical protein
MGNSTDPVEGEGQEQPQAGAPESTPPEPLTTQQREAVLALMKEHVPALATPVAQSLAAKAENRVNLNIQARIRGLEQNAKTLNLTAEQLAKAKADIVVEEMAAQPAEEEPQAPSRKQAPDEELEVDPVLSNVMDMMETAGVYIDDADPEFAEYIKPLVENPKGPEDINAGLLLAVGNAINAKKERLASEGESAAVRGGGIGLGGSARPSLSPDEKIRRGLQT